jgi:hypothetical protein
MKWVTNYNMAGIEHLTFVVNGEKTWAHWGAICPSTSGMLHVTQASFAHVMQLVKVECKCKCLPLLKWQKFISLVYAIVVFRVFP